MAIARVGDKNRIQGVILGVSVAFWKGLVNLIL